MADRQDNDSQEDPGYQPEDPRHFYVKSPGESGGTNQPRDPYSLGSPDIASSEANPSTSDGQNSVAGDDEKSYWNTAKGAYHGSKAYKKGKKAYKGAKQLRDARAAGSAGSAAAGAASGAGGATATGGAATAGAASAPETAGVGAVAAAALLAAYYGRKSFKELKKGDFRVTPVRLAIVLTGVGLATLAFAALAFLPSFLMKTITETSRHALMSRVDFAVERRAAQYIGEYVEKVIHPNLEACGTVNNTECYVADPGDGRLGEVAKYWRIGKIEDRLLARHGVRFEPSTTGDPADIQVVKNDSYYGNFRDYILNGDALRDFLDITEAEGINERVLVRHTVNSRFGSKWCLTLCNDEDSLSDTNIDILERFKLKISGRVLADSAARLGALFLCPVDDCTPEFVDNAARVAAKQALSTVDTDFLTQVHEQLPGVGIARFLSNKVTEDLLNREGFADAAGAAFSSIPIPGWSSLASLVSGVVDIIRDKLDTNELTQFNAEKNLAQYVSTATSIDSLSDETNNQSTLEEKGGAFRLVKGMVGSRFWAAINRIQKGTIYCADGTVLEGQNNDVLCDSKKIIQTNLDQTSEEFSNNQFINFFAGIAGKGLSAIQSLPVIGPLISSAQDVASSFLESMHWLIENPLVGVFYQNPDAELNDTASEIPTDSELGDNYFLGIMSRASAFGEGTEDPDGGWVGLGGHVLNAEQQAKLDLAIREKEQKELERQSIFARYFDLNNHASLLTRITFNFAVSLPVDGPLGFSVNPLSMFSNIGSLLQFSKPASAQTATGLQTDWYSMTKIPSIGFTPAELEYGADEEPEGGCENEITAHIESKAANEDAIIVPYDGATCMLEGGVVYGLTAHARLAPQEQQDAYYQRQVTGSTGGLGSGGGGLASPPGSILSDDYDKTQSTVNLECAPGPANLPLQTSRIAETARGGPIKLCSYGTAAWINAAWSRDASAMLGAAKAAGEDISGGGYREAATQIRLRRNNCGTSNYAIYEMPSSQCSPPTARPGSSNHEYGLAIDFSQPYQTCGSSARTCTASSTYRWLIANSENWGITKLGSESWHFSYNGN